MRTPWASAVLAPDLRLLAEPARTSRTARYRSETLGNRQSAFGRLGEAAIRAGRGGTLTLGESEAVVMFLALFALYSPPSADAVRRHITGQIAALGAAQAPTEET
jgi:hypothetical protein